MAFGIAQRAFGGIVVAAAILALSACAGVREEEPLPGARNTGVYPDLNRAPEVATDQLTDEEKEAKTAQLVAARTSNNVAGAAAKPPKSEAARLRLLGRTHADDALREIEK